MPNRPGNVMRRVVGMLLLIPGLLHVPLPEADFHVIRHHHGRGEVCPNHDHLLRWHPRAAESEDVAVLHWHWLLPDSLDLMLSDTAPALRAHVDDSVQPEWNGAPAVVSSEDRGRAPGSFDLASWLDLAPIDVGPLDAPRLAPPNAWPGRPIHDGMHPETSSAHLVRWNC